jgi:hypothetical protein
VSCHSYCQYCAARDAENADLQARLAECEQRNNAEQFYPVYCTECEWCGSSEFTTCTSNYGAGDFNGPYCPKCLERENFVEVEDAGELITSLRAQLAEAQKHAEKKRDALGRLDASPSALAQNSHPVANMSADSEAPTE